MVKVAMEGLLFVAMTMTFLLIGYFVGYFVGIRAQ